MRYSKRMASRVRLLSSWRRPGWRVITLIGHLRVSLISRGIFRWKSIESPDRYSPMETGIRITTPPGAAGRDILTDGALNFVMLLERRFGEVRRKLLAKRDERQKRLDAGELPDFLAETHKIRTS